MLVLRRLTAFVIDFALLLMVMSCGALLGAVGAISVGEHLDAPILLLVVTFFGLLDRWGGTPGKRICGIKLHSVDGRRIGLFHTFLRATVFLLLPFTLLLAADLACQLARQKVDSYVILPILSFALVVLPASTLLSLGRAGLHDLVAGVTVETHTPTTVSVPPPNAKLLTITSVLVALLICVSVTGPFRSTRPDLLAAATSGLNASATAVDVLQTVPSSPLFFDGTLGAFKHLGGTDGRRITFANSPRRMELRDESLVAGRKALTRDWHYVLAVTRVGLISADFQRSVAQQILTVIPPQSNSMTIVEFEWTGDFGMIRLVRRKRWVGVSLQVSEPPTILEPDDFADQSLRISLRPLTHMAAEFGLGTSGL